MNFLFFGDIVAESGRKAVIRNLSYLKEKYNIDFIIANGENSAHGKGITSKIYHQLIDAGIDVITLGNHSFSKSEIIQKIDQLDSLIRPANILPKDIGKSVCIKEVKGKRIAVVNLLGCSFMQVADDNPLDMFSNMLEDIDADMIFVDLHAEATAEKKLFQFVFQKKVCAIIGTHTHIQTADEEIREGCAYITDVGMCGPMHGIIGRDAQEIIDYIFYHKKSAYKPASGEAILNAVVIQVDDETNQAIGIERIYMKNVNLK